MTATIHLGDCRQIIATLDDESVASIVTDPPYELGFMGKKWDNSGIAYDVQLWTECLRVLKPGGHLLAFGGTRTYHRMASAIEDAGFEIRDSIHWLYGSGFPKSHDVSKGIDKQRHDRDDIYKVTAWIRKARDEAGVTNRDIDAAFGFAGMSGHWTSAKSQPAVPTLDQVPTLLDVLGMTVDDVPDDIRRLLWDLNGKKGQPSENWARRKVVGKRITGAAMSGKATGEALGTGGTSFGSGQNEIKITAPATDAAKQWQGWGTALKPAHEPIVVARKPLIGTVAANVQQHGTGALNIDGARIGYQSEADLQTTQQKNPGTDDLVTSGVYGADRPQQSVNAAGRWPANVITDGSIDAEWVRYFYSAKASKAERNAGLDGLEPQIGAGKGNGLGRTCATCGSSVIGGCNCPDRTFVNPAAKNYHPTVKPLALMRYLVRLVTPPGGTVLEPFAGSGTTLAAAILEGFDSIGCELTDDYLPIIEGRIAWAEEQMKPDPESLFNQ
jgi:DNA modification methylase